MTPYVAAENDEAVFVVPTMGGAMGASKLFVSNARRSEFVCLARACAVLRDAGRLTDPETIVDVGAHVGTTTIPALTRHGFARAVAIEPDPDDVRLLRANVALNGLYERVTVIEAALSDTVGQRWFVPGRKRGGWAKGQLTDEPAPDAVVVDTITLDSLIEAGMVDPTKIGLLWVGKGLKGLNEDVLRSASLVVKHRIPIVFVLPHDQHDAFRSFLRRLRENGYECGVDLRRPSLNESLSDWTPTFEPIDDLATLVPRKTITDVLVF